MSCTSRLTRGERVDTALPVHITVRAATDCVKPCEHFRESACLVTYPIIHNITDRFVLTRNGGTAPFIP